jgi:hypothetical protein
MAVRRQRVYSAAGVITGVASKTVSKIKLPLNGYVRNHRIATYNRNRRRSVGSKQR